MKMPLTLLAQPEQSNEAIGYDPTSPLEGFFRKQSLALVLISPSEEILALMFNVDPGPGQQTQVHGWPCRVCNACALSCCHYLLCSISHPSVHQWANQCMLYLAQGGTSYMGS